jgi:hypothetical protein
MKLILSLIIHLLSFSQCWAKTGLYSGTFDPPTASDISFIRESIEQFELDKLVVMIDRLHPQAEGYNTSSYERAKMLEVGLEDLGERIDIIIEPWSGKENYLSSSDSQIDLLIFEKPPEITLQIPPAVEKIIQDQHLYAEIPESMNSLKQSLYSEAFQAFLREISIIFPNENLTQIPEAPFRPLSSHLAHVERFIFTVIREKQYQSDQAQAFGKKAEKILISSERSKPYAKIHGINQAFIDPSPKPLANRIPFRLPSISKDQKHSFDIEIYSSDRFPKALFKSCLFQEDDTYLHLGSTSEALAYHQSEGFTEVFEIYSQAVRKLRTYHLVKNPSTLKIRFIVSNLQGEDTLQHVGYQLNCVSNWTKVNLVRHAHPSPLFTINPDCENTIFQSHDTFVIGFKNAISRLLEKNSDWKKTPFSSSGLQIDLYENNKTKERAILSKCVYGDQLLDLLDFFYSKGIRKFQYFGTSGSLSPNIHVGDAIIPLAFSSPQNASLQFQNQAVKLLEQTENKRLKPVRLHGWTQSPMQETESFLKNLLNSGNESIDVESRYYGEFFKAHPEANASMVLFVSDEPFGSVKLDHFNTLDQYVDDSFNSIIEAMELLNRLCP